MKEKIGSITLALSATLSFFQLQSEIVNLTTEDQFAQEVLRSDKPTVVKFAAEWCGVCQGIKKPFEDITQEKEFKSIKFVEVDIDKNQSLGQQNGVVGVPTFLYVAKGEKKGQDVGIKNMTTFKDDFRASLRKNFQVAQNEAPGALTSKEIVDSINKNAKTPEVVKETDVKPEEVGQPAAPATPDIAAQPQETPTTVTQEMPAAPTQEMPAAPAEEPGILGKLVAMIIMLIGNIKDLIVWVFDIIKGWFGK